MFKYRDHRGSLADSMETVQEFSSIAELEAYLHKNSPHLEHQKITTAKYSFDSRIGWDTHIVQVVGCGVLGFTDRDPRGTTLEIDIKSWIVGMFPVSYEDIEIFCVGYGRVVVIVNTDIDPLEIEEHLRTVGPVVAQFTVAQRIEKELNQ